MLLKLFASPRVVASMALLVAMFLWGSSYVALKYTVEAFHPIVMVTGRMLIASVALLVGWKWAYTIPWRTVPRQDWILLALLGFLEPALYLLFEGYALQYTTASQAGMIVAAQPLCVVILARVLLKEHLSRITAAGFGLALWGVIWLCADGVATETAPDPLLGNFLECLAVLCGAFYVIAAKRLSAACTPVLLTAAQLVMGLLFFLPILFLTDIPLPTEFPLRASLSVLYLGIMVSLVSFTLFNFAIVRLPAAQTGAFLNLVPLLTLLLGVVVLGETLTTGQWIASGLIMSGVLLSQSAGAPKRRTAAFSSVGVDKS